MGTQEQERSKAEVGVGITGLPSPQIAEEGSAPGPTIELADRPAITLEGEPVELLAQQELSEFLTEALLPRWRTQLVTNPLPEEREKMVARLCAESEICRILHQWPASDAMLRLVYYHQVQKPVDVWLSGGPSGQALRDRLRFCSQWLGQWLVHNRGRPKLVMDPGGGHAPYGFGAIIEAERRARRESWKVTARDLQWSVVDLDQITVEYGQEMARQKKLDQLVHFQKANFMSRGFIHPQVDLVVLIGVLCGMTEEEAVKCLVRISDFVKPGGEILAATLRDTAFAEDPMTFRTLCNVIGWHLRPKTLSQVKRVFTKAGLQIKGIMSERAYGDGQYAIVHAINPA